MKIENFDFEIKTKHKLISFRHPYDVLLSSEGKVCLKADKINLFKINERIYARTSNIAKQEQQLFVYNEVLDEFMNFIDKFDKKINQIKKYEQIEILGKYIAARTKRGELTIYTPMCQENFYHYEKGIKPYKFVSFINGCKRIEIDEFENTILAKFNINRQFCIIPNPQNDALTIFVDNFSQWPYSIAQHQLLTFLDLDKNLIVDREITQKDVDDLYKLSKLILCSQLQDWSNEEKPRYTYIDDNNAPSVGRRCYKTYDEAHEEVKKISVMVNKKYKQLTEIINELTSKKDAEITKKLAKQERMRADIDHIINENDENFEEQEERLIERKGVETYVTNDDINAKIN